MGKVKWNLKLFLSWNKLKKWNLHSIVWLTSATILHVMMFICPICTLLFFCSFTGEFAVAAVITFPHHQVSQREISKNIFFRDEKSINSDLWILMRNFFWDTLYLLFVISDRTFINLLPAFSSDLIPLYFWPIIISWWPSKQPPSTTFKHRIQYSRPA